MEIHEICLSELSPLLNELELPNPLDITTTKTNLTKINSSKQSVH